MSYTNHNAQNKKLSDYRAVYGRTAGDLLEYFVSVLWKKRKYPNYFTCCDDYLAKKYRCSSRTIVRARKTLTADGVLLSIGHGRDYKNRYTINETLIKQRLESINSTKTKCHSRTKTKCHTDYDKMSQSMTTEEINEVKTEVSVSVDEVSDYDYDGAETDFGGIDFVASKTDAPKVEKTAIVEKPTAPTSKAPTPVSIDRGKYKAKGKKSSGVWQNDYGALDLLTRTFTPSPRDSEAGCEPLHFEDYNSIRHAVAVRQLAVPEEDEIMKELDELIVSEIDETPF